MATCSAGRRACPGARRPRPFYWTGLYLLVAALCADLIAPTFAAQIEGGGWFAWQASPPMLVLAGLGLVFISIARHLGDQSQAKVVP